MRISSLLLILIFLTGTVSSCGDDPDRRGDEADSPTAQRPLTITDSILLGPGEQVHVGEPYNMVVDHGGSPSAPHRDIWISDSFSNTIFRFDPDGSLRARIGQAGPGPEEIQSLSLIVLRDPDLVGAFDAGGAVKWFDRESGDFSHAHTWQRTEVGRSQPVWSQGEGESFVVSALDFRGATSLAYLDLDTGEWEFGGVLPAPHRASVLEGTGGFAAFFGVTNITELAPDTLFTLVWGAHDIAYTYDVVRRQMSPLGEVPQRFRRNSDPDLPDLFNQIGWMPDDGLGLTLSSFAQGVWTLQDGRIAVVHSDLDGEGTPPAVHIWSSSYLTVLDPTRDEACVDLGLPGGSEVRAHFDVARDTLFILDRRLPQTLEDTSDDLETWLLKAPVPSMDDCPAAHRASGWLH
jgi:hypothetical protein